MRGVLSLFVVAFVLGNTSNLTAAALTRQAHEVPQYGVYELAMEAPPAGRNPYFDVDFRVLFVRPDQTQVTVDGFYDGEGTFKARAYGDTLGPWRWRAISNLAELDGHAGQFEVVPSELPGKLRRHRDDPRQFAYDNGRWFLHIGDTGYRYVTDTEPQWQAYIDQAAAVGFTKIRTWFCQGRGDVQVLFTADRTEMNLSYWQEIDRRVTYALDHYPHIVLQLIPYGEDTAEIARYGEGDRAALLLGQYAQARFSALPNVHWCLSNDRHIVARDPLQGRDVSPFVIDKMGRDFQRREPWGTLLTNHQQRFQGYSFVDAPWSDIITIEDLDEVAGAVLLQYRRLGDDPVILDEDRYELYRPPAHRRYYFRRLMWASLLSGGAATYGGLKTYEPYDGHLRGVQGYLGAVEAGKLTGGAHDFRYIHQFFEDSGLTLVGMEPADAMAGYRPDYAKCMASGDHIIVYLQNPDDPEPEKADVAQTKASVRIHLPRHQYRVRWYQPTTGQWREHDEVKAIDGGFDRTLESPFLGDAVLLLRRR